MFKFQHHYLMSYSDSVSSQHDSELDISNIFGNKDEMGNISSDDINSDDIYFKKDQKKEITEAESDSKQKAKKVFKIIHETEQEEKLPELFTENEINIKIKGMNLNKDMKKKSNQIKISKIIIS